MKFKCTSIDYTGTTIHSTFCNKCALLRTSISVFICGFPRHNLAFVIDWKMQRIVIYFIYNQKMRMKPDG